MHLFRKAGTGVLLSCAVLAVWATAVHAGATLPGTLVKGGTATCTDGTVQVVVSLSGVPDGTSYLFASSGAITGSRAGTTQGDAVTLTFTADCATVCGQNMNADMSLIGKGLVEDTPLTIPVNCKEMPPTSSTSSSTTTSSSVSTSTSTVPQSTTFTTPTTTTTGKPPLPRTGSSDAPLFTVVGIGAVAVGTVLIRRARAE